MPSPDKHPILSVRHLSTGYGKKQVLFDVSLEVMPGEIVLITGGNGSGKSTLLKAIYGLISPWNANGEILFRPDLKGQVVSTRNPSNNLAKGLAYLPQKNAVFDDLSVEDNLLLAGHILRDGKEFAKRRDEVLSFLPALARLMKRKPEKMSGGERQMVALGIVLLHRPRLLLLDEPTAGLDSISTHEIHVFLKMLSDKHSVSLLWIEHRFQDVLSLADKQLKLSSGIVIMDEMNIN